MRPPSYFPIVALAASALAGAAPPASMTATRTYVVPLSAYAEVAPIPGLAGDKDASGLVKLTVDLAAKQICYDFALSRVETPLMAHIHRAPEHSNGPSVVTLFTGPGGELQDCRMWTGKWLTEIVANPSNFYVNVYTTEYPDGALRGQLMG